MTVPRETIGSRIRRYRKALGWTQRELADATADHGRNITPAWISAIERNTPHPESGRVPRPDPAVVEALAGGLGIPVSELVDGTDYFTELQTSDAPVDDSLTLVMPPSGDLTLVNQTGITLRLRRDAPDVVSLLAIVQQLYRHGNMCLV